MATSAQMSHSPLGDFAGPPPILIAASSDEARARASIAVESGGFRTASVAIEDAVDRLDIQAAASAIWVELDRDAGAPLDRLLDRVEAESGRGSFPAIISAPSAMIDPVAARIRSPEVHLLFDPTPDDRVTTLALATAWTRARTEARNHDISKEPSAARLRQLSDEVSRIAATLARLSVGPGAPPEKPEPPSGEAPSVSLDTVRQVIRARRLRARYFDEELFADPAWDMLLDLLQAEIAQHRVPVSSLCIAAAVPATTALRWIKSMTDAGLFKRRADPHDGRRVFVELSASASDAMRRYFKEVGKVVVV
jgi:DNA-binding MarR family transcriptional regulator